MNFSEFCKENKKLQQQKKENVHINNQKDYSKNSQQSGVNKEEARDIFNKYNGYSKDELMNELIQKTNQKKQEGTFNSNELYEIKRKLSPYLTQEQNKNLDEIVKRLK